MDYAIDTRVRRPAIAYRGFPFQNASPLKCPFPGAVATGPLLGFRLPTTAASAGAFRADMNNVKKILDMNE